MRITHLEVQNIKRIRAISCELKDGVVVIEGDNRQGKTSLLDSIAMALGGKELVPEKPIRDGEKEGYVKVVMDDIEVVRHWKNPYESRLVIKNVDGEPIVTKPQSFLNERIGQNTLDVMNFINMNHGEKVRFFQGITGLDLDKLRDQREAAYQDRRDFNRQITQVATRLSAYPEKMDKPTKVDAKEIEDKLTKAAEHNQKRIELGGKLKQVIDSLETTTQNIVEWEKQLKEARELEEHLQKRQKELALEVKNTKPIDTKPMQDELSNVRQMAQAEIDYTNWRALKDQHADLMKSHDAAQKLMDETDAKIQAAIQGAKLPIEDLRFDGQEIYYHDIPIEQCSEEERITIGIAVGVQENPKLRTLLVRDASGVGAKALKRIEKIAKEKKFQIILEKQADKKGEAIYIEDGLIK